MNIARALVLAAFAFSTACGSDEHGNHFDAAPPDPPDAANPPLGPIALADLPGALSTAVCAFEARCGLMPDVATCSAVFDPATSDVAQLTAYVGTVLTYDATKAGECLTAYRDASCTWTATGLGPAAVCDEVFTGDKVAGVGCFVDEECIGDMICETAACVDGCCPGTCKAKTAAVAIGADCSGAPCSDGAYCQLDGAGAATCALQATAGSACTAVDGCEAGSACNLDATGHGSCVRLAGAGEACDPTVAAGSCAGIDRWCNPGSSTCELRKAIGASCTAIGECIEAGACTGGICALRPKPGEACGPAATGGGCLGDLPCVSGLCTADAVEAVCP